MEKCAYFHSMCRRTDTPINMRELRCLGANYELCIIYQDITERLRNYMNESPNHLEELFDCARGEMDLTAENKVAYADGYSSRIGK